MSIRQVYHVVNAILVIANLGFYFAVHHRWYSLAAAVFGIVSAGANIYWEDPTR